MGVKTKRPKIEIEKSAKNAQLARVSAGMPVLLKKNETDIRRHFSAIFPRERWLA
jgi:hypothetical protein